MTLSALLLLLFGLAAIGFVAGRGRAIQFTGKAKNFREVHSRSNYHGWFSALWTLIPAALLVMLWAAFAHQYIDPVVLSTLPDNVRPTTPLDAQVFMNEVRGLATGQITDAFTPGAKDAVQTYTKLTAKANWIVTGLALSISLLGFVYAYFQVKPAFRARTQVERFVMSLLIIASIVAILTTAGILLSLLFESFRFFQSVSVIEFLTGRVWSPQTALRADQVGSSGAFGAVPLFWGTIFISAIAMVVAVPIGLMSAVYLTQYASARFRKWMKPLLEVLAGVPTVVYGFFAALTVAPLVRNIGMAIGITDASSESALAAGAVMGVMIIPFMSSLSDDAITAVPQAMRDGSLALGATTSETIRKVLIPAALPGIVGGFLLAVSRAIGETMIVVMAAGLAANLTLNPFASVTTVTAQIVALLTGDQEFDSPKTLSAFALGLVLFLVTLVLNIYALRVVKKYREAYE